MSTNKVVLRTTEEFMQGYEPVYKPLYAALLGNSQAYSEEVGKINFNRLEAVGDIRAKHITPKDSEIAQLSVKGTSKTFKKYFLANQYIQSALQSNEDVEGIVAQVLDEHQKQMDELVLFGEGTQASDVVNNGLFYSADGNYVLENSDEMANAPDTQAEMYEKVMGTLADARDVPGRKAIIFYGATTLSKLDSLFPDKSISLMGALQAAIAGDASILRMPSAVTPASKWGWMVVNLDRTKLHYVALPSLKDQGVNSEKMYSWHNFLMGSAMVEVQTAGGIIHQPVTFEA